MRVLQQTHAHILVTGYIYLKYLINLNMSNTVTLLRKALTLFFYNKLRNLDFSIVVDSRKTAKIIRFLYSVITVVGKLFHIPKIYKNELMSR